MPKFEKDQKVALIGRNSITECYVEKVTKTKLTIRHTNGHVSNTGWMIRNHHDESQTGHHARSSYLYWKEHVEVWGEQHDRRIEDRNVQMRTQRRLNDIKSMVASLHVSQVELIDQLMAVLSPQK
jgi:hypothetical protein